LACGRAIAPEGMPELLVMIGDKRREWEICVEEFIEAWPAAYANRQFDLGSMFDPKQFPSPAQMPRKFYFIFDTSIQANPNDIRFAKGITPEAAEECIELATKAATDKYVAAATNAATKLYKVVQSMHETMKIPHGETGAKFNDSKLENIINVAELMPMLNVTGDPKLAELAKKAKKLAQKSPLDLRGDVEKRKAAAEEAGKLAASIADAFDVVSDDDL
jgi:hypothetical protein